METKQIRLNVNIFFEVPANYEVTDTESIEFLGKVILRGEEDNILAEKVAYHDTIEAVDLEDYDNE